MFQQPIANLLVLVVLVSMSKGKALGLAVDVEGDSEHTIARGIRTSAEERHLALPDVHGFEAIQGRGAMAHSSTHIVYVGGPYLLQMLNVRLPEALECFERQRELEVLHLLAQGNTNQQIAKQLTVATGTVKAHAASIYRKLDVANRTEAVARARQLRLRP